MIAKRSIRRSGSRFKILADYITGKAREFWTENCSDDLELAVAHMEAVQALNTKARSDKTYHLVVAFPEGERPRMETLKDIERTLADRLGYTEHQRLVALHDDTRHLHLHIAISKIHPETLKTIEPFRDFQKLFDACRALESKHSLQKLAPNSAPDRQHPMEQREGLQSFTSWLKEKLPRPMKDIIGDPTQDWTGLHRVLGSFDVALRKHGSGFVFSHRSAKLFCKVSDIDRSFSLKKLEARFGPFQPCEEQYPFQQTYKPGPMHGGQETKELFALFTLERDQKKEKRSLSVADFQAERKKNREDILHHYQKLRLEVRLDRILGSAQKKRVYKALSERMRKDLSKAHKENAEKRKEIFSRNKVPRWRQWLEEKAGSGNEKALSALRSTRRQGLSSDNYVSLPAPLSVMHSEYPRAVSLEGIVTYRMKGGDLIDHGQQLCIPGSSPRHMKEALSFIVEKFGEKIEVHGSPEFKAIAHSILKARQRNTKQKSGPSAGIEL